jgi:hypothetical protein
MKKSEAFAVVAILAASFPRAEIGEPTIEAYAVGLTDLGIEETTAAVRTLQQTSRFFPTIAEIRETVAELRLGAPPPMHAWEQAYSRNGQRHPLVRRARRIVGDDWDWRQTPTGVLQKAFLAAYAEAKKEAVNEIVAPMLAAARTAVTAPAELNA